MAGFILSYLSWRLARYLQTDVMPSKKLVSDLLLSLCYIQFILVACTVCVSLPDSRFDINSGKLDLCHLFCLGELFRRSCVPGILDTQYNAEGTNPVNLCENCAAGGMDKCQRNTRELYYGDSGAFRCLVESK